MTLAENRKKSIRCQQIYFLFLKKPEMELTVDYFERLFTEHFGAELSADELKAKFPDLLEVSAVRIHGHST